MDPKKTETVRVADSELYYEIYGSGDPLILIHGAWTDRRIWQPQIEAFSEKYQVIAYDQRGHGRSTVGDLPYSPVDDLTTLMDRLFLDKAILVGHESGGAAARAMAIERFDRVSALVLVSAGNQGLFGVPMPDEELDLLGRPLAAAREGDRETAVDLHEEIWINGVDHEADPAIRDSIRAIVEECPFSELQPGAPEVMWTAHRVQEMHLIHLPVLLTWGLNDQPLIERTALMTADILNDCRTASIAGAAHYVNWEKAEELNQMILDFL